MTAITKSCLDNDHMPDDDDVVRGMSEAYSHDSVTGDSAMTGAASVYRVVYTVPFNCSRTTVTISVFGVNFQPKTFLC